MRHKPIFLLSCLLLAPVATLAQNKDASNNKKLYCWNENGQRVCSDALPAEAVNRAREEISARSGLKMAEIDRALTDEERAVAAAEAAQQLLDEAKLETRRRTEQAMLTSYRSEEELMRVFTERTAIVDNNVRTAQYNVDSLRDGLVSLLQVAGDRELDGKPVSKDMTDNIRRRHTDLMRQLQLQANFERQRVELDDEVAETLQRYRAMKGDSEPGVQPSPVS